MKVSISEHKNGFVNSNRKTVCVDIVIPEREEKFGFEASFSLSKVKAKKLALQILETLEEGEPCKNNSK